MEYFQQSVDQLTTSFTELSPVNKGIVAGILGYTSLNLLKTIVPPVLQACIGIYTKIKSHEGKYEENKIYLHIPPRSMMKKIPNASPYSLKVETWLRLHKIAHEVVETFEQSKRTKQFPFIIHKGKEITDSTFIMEYLEKELGLDTSEGLAPEQLGVSRAISQMLDESTVMSYCLHRYCYDFQGFQRIFQLPMPFKLFLTRQLSKDFLQRMVSRGIGRKTKAEVYHIGNEDIRAVANYLGDKSFLMGNKITKVDCTVFCHLCQIVFVDFHYPHMDFIRENCPNLLPYMDRIKTQLYPDWDEIVPKGHFS